MSRRACSAAAFVLALGPALEAPAAPGAAELAPRTFRIEVHAGAGCPEVDGVRDALAVSLRTDAFDPSAGALLVVDLVQVGELARGRWEMVGPDGAKIRERSVTITGTCRQLVSELAVTFAVFYETHATPCPPPTCDDACKARAREEARRQLLLEGYRPPMDLTVGVLAGALLSAGFTADPGPGLFLGGEMSGEVLSGALEARVLFPSRVVAEPSKFEFSMTAVTAALVPCGRWKVLMGCLFVDVGMLIGGGNVSFASNPVIATFGFGPRFAVHVPFAERFGVRAFADLRIAPVPSVRNFIDTGARWESNVVSGLFGLALGFK